MSDDITMASAALGRLDEELIVATKSGNNEQVSRLLSAGANKDAEEKNTGATPLYIASENGHEACALALLKAGAKVDATRNDGRTSLYIACARGHQACVRMLVNAGANMEIAHREGRTPLYIACAYGHDACARILVNAGANMEVVNKDGRTALHIACLKGYEICVRVLLGAGANMESKRPDGSTPLIVACEMGHEACVRALLNAGASVHSTPGDCCTPLSIACAKGHEACVRALLDASVSQTQTLPGSTLLDIARTCDHVGIARFLQEEADGKLRHVQAIGPQPSSAAAVVRPCAVASSIAENPFFSRVPSVVLAQTLLSKDVTVPPTLPVLATEISSSELEFDCDGDEQIELGHGSVGIVYSGRWKGEHVAIKKTTLPVEVISNGIFASEVLLHMRASHKHVVRLYGAAMKPVPGSRGHMACYLVMERLATDLFGVLHNSFGPDHPAFSVAVTLRALPKRIRLLLEIVRGVRFLHAQGIVHADLKPANVLLDRFGHAQLTDFGLAVQRKLDASRTCSTQLGMRGSMSYMDPLLLSESTSVKPSSDMYSWGVLAWEVLTLLKPNEGTMNAIAGAGTSCAPGGVVIPSFLCRTFGGERPHDVLARVPDVPPALRELIERCWSEDQSARPTAEDAIAVLEPLVEG
ncbi:MAG: hypothetical protein EOO65_01615 [Methanosarcinales archaeon]|nr:MAG: hypothetical protein EOO65_01615 [Methanosarcinales archaeon]